MASRSSRIKVPQDFWSQFGDFVPNPQAGLETEFKRLARHQGWQPNSTGWREYRAQAYIYEIQSHYGNDSTKLECWQILCKQVGIYPEPQSISKCKEALKHTHVNLMDLVNSQRLNRPPRIFPSVQALRKYTLADRKRMFPKELAKQEGFIRQLLRHLV